MPVITAAGLAKRIGDRTLFADLSFKLERGERMTLPAATARARRPCCGCSPARRDRRAAGCRSARASGWRCTISARRANASHPARVRGSGRAGMIAIEAELARLEAEMVEGDSDQATLRAYADAQARLEHAGGYRWRDGGRSASCAASASPTTSSTGRSRRSPAAS